MIQGVEVKGLKVLADKRGRLMEILRADDKEFVKFGQVYITTAFPGFAKAWHYHAKQYDFFTCVKGKIRLVLYDQRENSKTRGEIQEFIISMEENPVLVKIPPLVCHGFEAVGPEEAIVVNTVTEPYNYEKPDEHRLKFDDPKIGFKWAAREGG